MPARADDTGKHGEEGGRDGVLCSQLPVPHTLSGSCLLQRGADRNARDAKNKTPGQLASEKGHHQLASQLSGGAAPAAPFPAAAPSFGGDLGQDDLVDVCLHLLLELVDVAHDDGPEEQRGKAGMCACVCVRVRECCGPAPHLKRRARSRCAHLFCSGLTVSPSHLNSTARKGPSSGSSMMRSGKPAGNEEVYPPNLPSRMNGTIFAFRMTRSESLQYLTASAASFLCFCLCSPPTSLRRALGVALARSVRTAALRKTGRCVRKPSCAHMRSRGARLTGAFAGLHPAKVLLPHGCRSPSR